MPTTSKYQQLPPRPPHNVPPIDPTTGRWHPLWEQWIQAVEQIVRETQSKV
jgi:hypothetical protein